MSSEKLNIYNILNIIALGLSLVLQADRLEGPGHRNEDGTIINGIGELFWRYESIVMPTSNTFLIAHIVLFFEGVFTLVQCLPKYRGSVMVQDCVKHWFFTGAVCQFIWSIDIGLENIFAAVFSTVLVGVFFFSITKILMSQAANTIPSEQSPEEYWFLRFPFSLHFGWALAVLAMSINGFFVSLGFGRTFQVVLGIITLFIFAGVGYKMLYKNGPRPNYIIPLILSWFCIGIATEEQGPKVNLEGGLHLFFDITAGIIGAVLIVTTLFVFYQKEYKSGDLSNEIKEANDADDAVYVTAPDGKDGASALA